MVSRMPLYARLLSARSPNALQPWPHSLGLFSHWPKAGAGDLSQYWDGPHHADHIKVKTFLLGQLTGFRWTYNPHYFVDEILSSLGYIHGGSIRTRLGSGSWSSLSQGEGQPDEHEYNG